MKHTLMPERSVAPRAARRTARAARSAPAVPVGARLAAALLALSVALAAGPVAAQGDAGATGEAGGAPAAFASVAPSAAPPGIEGTLVEVIHDGRFSAADVQRLAGPAFGGYGPVVTENAVEAYRIRFVTTGLDDEPTVVAAQAFLPVREDPDGMPMFVFGSGTTGIGDQCAPSREVSLGRPLGLYREYLMAYAARGFATIIPDYVGFEDPDRVQAYFHARSEAHVMLDAVRAARQLVVGRPGVPRLSDDVFVGGYSQGGHAAFSAADLAEIYAPDVRLSGVIGYGATTNVERLLQDGPYYAPYIAVSYDSIYGRSFDPSSVLAPRWVPTVIADTIARCVDQAQTYYPFDRARIYTAEFARSLQAGTLATDFPDVHEVLEANRTGLTGHGVPSLVIQGSDDIIATNRSQERFVAELCETGVPVVYLNVAGARHRHTKPAGFEPAVSWMKEIASGAPAPSTCG